MRAAVEWEITARTPIIPNVLPPTRPTIAGLLQKCGPDPNVRNASRGHRAAGRRWKAAAPLEQPRTSIDVQPSPAIAVADSP
jgi:hypothetical protein